MPKFDVVGYPFYPFGIAEIPRPTADEGAIVNPSDSNPATVIKTVQDANQPPANLPNPVSGSNSDVTVAGMPPGQSAVKTKGYGGVGGIAGSPGVGGSGLNYGNPNVASPVIGQSTSTAPITESLTNVTNMPRPFAPDVYGNDTWKDGDNWQQIATRSPRDPNGLENPEAGAYHEEHPLYCDTCQKRVPAEEMAFPGHLGHDIRNDYAKTDFDISHAVRCGGTFPIGFGSPTILPPNPNYDVGYPSNPMAGSKYQGLTTVGDPVIAGNPQDMSSSSDTTPPTQFPNNYVSQGWTNGSVAGNAGGPMGPIMNNGGPLGAGGKTGINRGRFGVAPCGGFPADDNNWLVQKNDFAFAPQPFNIIPSVQAIPDAVFGDGELDQPNSKSIMDDIVDQTIPGMKIVNS